MSTTGKPIRLLIAALGGEGGGVLAGWISEAASDSDLVVSRTSIPGVAQRTGATTYYIEMMPAAGAGPRPILSLNPAPGQVDILIATELLEAARMVHAGFITPDRTAVIGADRRVYATDEKVAMGDGRVDEEKLREVIRRFSKRLVLDDMMAVAQASGSQINVVMLGVLAGLKVLPISDDMFRATIRADGRAVEANIRGFEAGLAMASKPARTAVASAVPVSRAEPAGAVSGFPSEAHAVLREGVARLTDYQNAAYAQRYLDRVARFAGRAGADGTFIRELARHLAVRMSVEDVIRVAQLKLREERVARVAAEGRARGGDIVDITEYLKPGPDEIFGLLPPGLGKWALSRVRPDRAWPLKVRTTRLSGFLRLKFLSVLRFWRPRTLRQAEEEAWVERWLALVDKTLAADPEAAREVVATAALVRGYGDTYKRGLANWARIMEEIVAAGIEGRLPRGQFADAVLQARLAASKDPEGEALTRTIAAIDNSAAGSRLAAE
jgi:indolepyruvate ferredoxin oxidoreductase beta subunit